MYGIRFEIPEDGASPHEGLYAISANLLLGYHYVALKDRAFVRLPHGRFTWLQRFPVADRVGNTFFIFEIP